MTDEGFDALARRLQSDTAQAPELEARQLWADHPDEPQYARLLATILWNIGRHDEASGVLSRALDRDPESTTLRNGLGWIQLASGDPEVAERTVKLTLNADPGNVEARVVLGRSLNARGRFRDALTVLEPVARQSSSADARHAYAAARLGRWRVPIALLGGLTVLTGFALLVWNRPLLGLAVWVLPAVLAIPAVTAALGRPGGVKFGIAAAGVLAVLYGLFWLAWVLL